MSDDSPADPRESSITPDKLRQRLADELARALDAGREIRLSSFARRFGLPMTDVQRCLDAVRALRDAAGPPSGAADAQPLDRAAAASATEAAPPDGPPPLPADYEVLGEIGRGAMGVVYRVRQRALDRIVAVKVLGPGHALFGNLADRFRREVKALARLRHPHIVSVHEVGEIAGCLYFAMDLVEGRTLADVVRAGELTPARTVKLVREAASAIAATHAHGLVHRDLKPGNILVDAEDRAFVVDFGLARDLSVKADLTGTGQVIGTPAYMSPEQARGDAAQIGERSDVYALGAVLYECLTGHAPFEGASLVDVIRAVVQDEPRAPRSIDARIPRDLEVICQTAMAKEPERRYQTAQALVEDLERFAEGLPIRARPAGPVGRLTRWARRNPAVAASVSGTFVALAAGLAVTLALLAEARRERNAKTAALGERDVALADATRLGDERGRALADLEKAHHRSRVVGLVAASAAAQDRNPMLAVLVAREAARRAAGDDGPEAVQRLVDALDRSHECARIAGHADAIAALAVSPGGRLLVTGSADATAGVWDDAGRALATLAHGATVLAAAVSPDDRLVATIDRTRTVRIWDTAGTLRATVRPSVTGWGSDDGSPARLAWSPDGASVTACDQGLAVTFDRDGGSVAALEPGVEFAGLCALPDGRFVTAESGAVHVRAADGRDVASISIAADRDVERREVAAVAAQDGVRVLVYATTGDAAAALWDTASGARVDLAPPAAWGAEPGGWAHRHQTCAAFSPDGSACAIGRFNGTVWIFGADGRAAVRLAAHRGSITSLAFSADGTRLLTTSEDGTARVHDRSTGTSVVLDAAGGPVLGGAFVGATGRIATFDSSAVHVWDPFRDPATRIAGAGIGAVRGSALTADGRLLFGTHAGKPRLTDLSGALVREADLGSPARSACLSPDGTRALVACADGFVRILDRDLREVARLDAREDPPPSSNDGNDIGLRDAAFDATGTRVVTTHTRDVFRVFATDGTLLSRFGAGTARAPGDRRRYAQSAAIAPAGDRVVTVSFWFDTPIVLWDGAGRRIAGFEGAGPGDRPVFSPDGTRLVVTGAAARSCVTDRDGNVVARLATDATDWFGRPVFSSDGRRFAAPEADGRIRIWDADGRQTAVLGGCDAAATCIAFSPDGARVAAAAADGTVRVWSSDGRSLLVLRARPAALAAQAAGASSWSFQTFTGGARRAPSVVHVEFTPDGRRVVAGCDDDSVLLFDVADDAILARADARAVCDLAPDDLGAAADLLDDDPAWRRRLAARERVAAVLAEDPYAPDVDAAIAAGAVPKEIEDLVREAAARRRTSLGAVTEAARSVVIDPDRTPAEYERALRRIEHVVAVRPPHVVHVETRALALIRCGRAAEAVTVAESLAGRDLPDFRGWSHERIDEPLLALAQILAGRAADARPAAGRLLAFDPRATWVDKSDWRWKAELTAAVRRLDPPLAAAIDAARAAVLEHPLVAESVAAVRSDPALGDQARALAVSLLDGREDDAGALNARAWDVVSPASVTTDAAREAVRWARRAVELEPGDAAYVNTLGVALYRAGECAEAAETLRRNQEENESGYTSDGAFRAMALARLGRLDEARAVLAKARETTGGDADDDDRRLLDEAAAVIDGGDGR